MGRAESQEEAPGSLATSIERLSDPGNMANKHHIGSMLTDLSVEGHVFLQDAEHQLIQQAKRIV